MGHLPVHILHQLLCMESHCHNKVVQADHHVEGLSVIYRKEKAAEQMSLPSFRMFRTPPHGRYMPDGAGLERHASVNPSREEVGCAKTSIYQHMIQGLFQQEACQERSY